MKVQAVLTKKSAKKEQENGSALTRQAKLAQSCWALKGLREKGRVAITRNQHAQSLRNLAHAQIRMHKYTGQATQALAALMCLPFSLLFTETHLQKGREFNAVFW
jgi:hypothetical protein